MIYQPTSNKIKDMADARSTTTIKCEMYESKKVMKEKEHVGMYDATCAKILSLLSNINGTGAIAYSWFGSGKTSLH